MRVDEQFMEEVGLSNMPESEKQAFMQHAEEELEVRVGQGIGAELTDEQLIAFEQIEDLEEVSNWLEQTVPGYREIVMRIYQAFKQEILAEQQNILS